ncbi:glycosyltransferase [Hyphococcus sp.]|uniref:glycosyltransferase n=1 Tax=Hyphococcus sp. TaxID=2038636 RepID=UPI003CCB8D0C
MTSPKFVISVPIGAYHPLLRDCLQSLAVQEPKPAVAILDASGDARVAEVIAEFADMAVYHRAGPDGGQSDAIVEGWNHVDGDILGWLNADDALYPGALRLAARQFEKNPDTDLFYGHSLIIDDNEAVKGYHWAVEPPSETILSGDIISQPSCFFRRKKIDEIGGLNRDLHYTMDWDLWVRLWRAEARFDYTEEVLSRVLWSSDAKTGGFNRARRKELERIIGASSGLARRMKSRAGFALHHLFEYATPAFAANALRGLPLRRMRTINGLDRLGRFQDTASLPLVHYRPHNMKGLTVNIQATSPVSISAGGATLEAAGAGAHALLFDAQGCETFTLRLENHGGKPAKLVSVQWRD